MFKRRGKKSQGSEQRKFLHLLPLGNHDDSDGSNALSNFDACIEACDSLAATPATAEFQDCSVLISPDGILLGPRRSEAENSLQKSSDPNTSDHAEAESLDGGGMAKKGDGNEAPILETESSFEEILVDEKSNDNENDDLVDDYESAIYIGNDMIIDGEKKLNGFSTRGWNPIMATMAIGRAEETLRGTGSFVEELILAKKNGAAGASQACEKLRDIMLIDGADHLSVASFDVRKAHSADFDLENTAQKSRRAKTTDDISLQASLTPGQKSSAGPLLFPGSTLQEALGALDRYHTLAAEGDAHRWRMASTKSYNDNGALPQIQRSAARAKERAQKRERALMDSQQRQAEAEANLRSKKERSRKLWLKVESVEEIVRTKVADLVRQRSRGRELQRRKEESERQMALSDVKLESTVTNQEILELVREVGEVGEDFAPTDLPTPNFHGPIDQSLRRLKSAEKSTEDPQQAAQIAAEIDDYRIAVEFDLGLDPLRKRAIESDEQVQDAAGALLNIISAADTTMRSARLAAETALLACANAQVKCLKSLVKLERESINERLRLIDDLERAVNSIDVRADLNDFVEHEKKDLPNGSSKLGDTEDGGIASALAVLNSHSEGIGVGIGVAGMAELSSFTGWGEDDGNVYDREELEDAVDILFKGGASDPEKKKKFSESIELLSKAVGEKSVRARGYRASTCYAMNNHRGKVTQLEDLDHFEGLCKVLKNLLDGCDRESADVASAKMVMMLAQTFYVMKEGQSDDRTKRIYPKDRLCSHRIWLDEDFWVQALFQCVTDSLSNSGVMVRVRVRKRAANKSHKMRWHDLRPNDRADAASQVHAVIFAQLGALAHSMVEFGCSVEKACHFVRRLSVRHQLPLTQRSMLLDHLLKREAKMEFPHQKNESSVPS